MRAYPLLALAALPFSASAALTEMADTELSQISGQAWIISYPHLELRIDDLSDRDISLGPIPISGLISKLETLFPVRLEKARGRFLNSLEFSVSLSAGVLRTVVPVLGSLPEATVRFETTP